MNRIIVVTGGAAGIGRCTVEYFASKGSFTGLLKRDQTFHQDQMSRAADRQPFGNTFHNTINNCFDHF